VGGCWRVRWERVARPLASAASNRRVLELVFNLLFRQWLAVCLNVRIDQKVNWFPARARIQSQVAAHRERHPVGIEMAERAARVRWLSRIIPRDRMFGMPLETSLVFEEAKASFVYGNFVAVIVLAAAFIEHWFIASLEARGYHKEASQGLAAAISCARRNNLVDSMILDKSDRLRLIRNPFVH
jgi:hypothetical protein